MNTEQLTTTERKIERFSQILSQMPGDELTVLALAEASFRRGLKLEALTAYQAVTKEKPVPEAHLAVAEIYSQQNMINEAYTELSKLFEIDPENVEARLLAHTLEDIAPLPDEIQEILNVPTSDRAFEEADLRLRIQVTIHNRELQERTRNVTLEPGVVIHEYYVEEAKKKLMDIQEQLRQMVQLKAHNESLRHLPPPRPEPVAPQAEVEPEVETPASTDEPALGVDLPLQEAVVEQPVPAVSPVDDVSDVLSETVPMEPVDAAPEIETNEPEGIGLTLAQPETQVAPLEVTENAQPETVAQIPVDSQPELQSSPTADSAGLQLQEASMGEQAAVEQPPTGLEPPQPDIGLQVAPIEQPTEPQPDIGLQVAPIEQPTEPQPDIGLQVAPIEQPTEPQPDIGLQVAPIEQPTEPQPDIGLQVAPIEQPTEPQPEPDFQVASSAPQSGIELQQPLELESPAPEIQLERAADEDFAAAPPQFETPSSVDPLQHSEELPSEGPTLVEPQLESPVKPDFPEPDVEPQPVLEVGDTGTASSDSFVLQTNALNPEIQIQTQPEASPVEPLIEPPGPDLPELQLEEPEQAEAIEQPFPTDFVIDNVVPPDLPDEPTPDPIQVADTETTAAEPITATPEHSEASTESLEAPPVAPPLVEPAETPPESLEAPAESIEVSTETVETPTETVEAPPEPIEASNQAAVIEDVGPELTTPEVVPSPAAAPGNAAARQAYYESKAEELGKLTGALARTRGVTSIFLVARDGSTIDSVVKDDVTEARVGELVKESFEFLLAYAKSPSYWVLECTGGIFVMQTLDDHHVLIAIGQAGANFGALRYTMDKTKAKFGDILDNVPL